MDEKDIKLKQPEYIKIFSEIEQKSPELTETEKHDRATKAYDYEMNNFSKYLSEVNGKKFFNLSGFITGNGDISAAMRDSNLQIDGEATQVYVQYASKSSKELREISYKLYNYIQEYKQLIQRYSTMLNYYAVVNPTQDVTMEEFIDALKFFEGYGIANKLPQITERLLKQDIFFGYDVRQRGDTHKILKEMPFNHCKLVSRDKFGVYVYKFDLSYFDSYSDEIESFPQEFKNAYKTYKDKKTNNWFIPDITKQFAFKFDTTTNYALPYFTGLFVDLVRLQEVKTAQTLASKTENYKLITFKVPINDKSGKTDDYLINGDDAGTYHKNAVDNTPEGVGVVTNPFEAKVLSLKGSGETTSNIVERHFSNLMSSAGMSTLLSNNLRSGSTGIDKSIEVDEGLMFKVLRQYEAFFTRQLHYRDQKSAFKVKFINSSIHNQSKVFDKYLSAAQAGLNRFYVSSAAGISQLEAIYGRKIEKEMGLDDLFNPMLSAHTMSGNDSNDDEVTDEGANSRDKD